MENDDLVHHENITVDMYQDLNTWAAETGQQVAVRGKSLARQGRERRYCRGELGQLGGKMTRKRGSSLTEEKNNINIKPHVKSSFNKTIPKIP